MDPKKIANNILEFMFDPTVIPVEKRMYFRPEERLDNGSFEKAKADSFRAYGKETKNSDFYPSRNKQTQREAGIMDRKTIIASLDVLSQNFDENDSIGENLRAMAYTVSKMADEEFETRTAKKKVEFVTCPKCGNKKVMKQTGYCLACKTKGIGKDDKKEDKKGKKKAGEGDLHDFWSKEASDAVALALVQDVVGTSEEDAEKEDKPAKEAVEKKDEPCKDEEASASKKKDEDDDDATVSAKVKEEKCPPEPEKKAADAPVPEAPKEEVPAPEAPAPEDKKEKAPKDAPAPAEEPKKEDIDAKKKIVDTSILANVEGIEMDMGSVSLDEVELTAADKAQLDKLFQ
jgi:hypothetical protein